MTSQHFFHTMAPKTTTRLDTSTLIDKIKDLRLNKIIKKPQHTKIPQIIIHHLDNNNNYYTRMHKSLSDSHLEIKENAKVGSVTIAKKSRQ